MKAYKAWDNASIENYSTIVFAENSREAKKVAFTCDVCEDADYIQVRVKRLPEADKLYKGKPEIDWWDEETRLTSTGRSLAGKRKCCVRAWAWTTTSRTACGQKWRKCDGLDTP